uniref:Uncharacterized protein n=1 Tax=Lepeophtheirus salmonis TaxID=72036 RepID=A0A0K2U274_LEPSM
MFKNIFNPFLLLKLYYLRQGWAIFIIKRAKCFLHNHWRPT